MCAGLLHCQLVGRLLADRCCCCCPLHRYHQLSRANEHLSDQLKEAHETLYELQTAVQATPVHKPREQQHLMSRLHDAEQVGSQAKSCAKAPHLRHVLEAFRAAYHALSVVVGCTSASLSSADHSDHVDNVVCGLLGHGLAAGHQGVDSKVMH